MYPSPKGKINDIYQVVSNDLKKPAMKITFKKSETKQGGWICTIKVAWPEENTFTGSASNKGSASNTAAIKCLQWLENQRKLKHGVPILYDSNATENILNRPVNLSIDRNTLIDVKILLGIYDEKIQHIVQNTNTQTFEHQGYQAGAIIDPVGKSNPANRDPDKLEERNEILKHRYNHRMLDYDVDLPIETYKDQIINAIENNQVVLIKGDTGCGKTTQVPQYIMDSFAKRGEATNCNIIISQPRRISAVSLAERVAAERKEQVGDVIGYQVRLSQQLPNTPAGILFCTTGLLLRKLQFNSSLEGCSHVIVDEAHERTINTDMLLVLLKRALVKNPKLKIIIMSATINAELFQNYFNCNVIEIPGRTFPVEMNFMEDINKLRLQTHSRYDNTFGDSDKSSDGPTVDIVKMGALISWIARNQPPGAILCFLPGWAEIGKMRRYLEEYAYMSKHETMIVPMHSKMSNFDQRKIFSKPPPRVRKIVLATDIAETGITVADVVYVVDSCTHRQVCWNEKHNVTSINNHWASQANIMQRKGRAGRVKAGVSYHFISSEKFDKLPPYPIPEIKRSSLEKTVLDAKTYSQELAADFLGAMPEPPTNRMISQAVQDLVNLGALDYRENLTPLGKRISLFTVHPKLSKAMVYSSIFQCVSPVITIASVMSSESEIFSGVLQDKGGMRDVKRNYHPTSDHVSLAWLFQQWDSLDKISREDSRQFSLQSKLYPERMFTLSKVRGLNAEHMVYAQLLPDLESFDNMSMKENAFAELDELVRGVLLSGVDQVLHQRDFDMRKGQLKKGIQNFVLEDGGRATITPESVNFKRVTWPSPYLTYVGRTHSEERRTSLIRETSIISPLTVFLFSQTKVVGFIQNKKSAEETEATMDTDNDKQMILLTLKGRRNVKLVCDRETAEVMLNFRDAMWSVIRYFVANTGTSSAENIHEYEEVNVYKTQMLQVLAKMLSEAAGSIDNPEPATKKLGELHDIDEDLA